MTVESRVFTYEARAVPLTGEEREPATAATEVDRSPAPSKPFWTTRNRS
ncbi:hypothetical protein ACIQKE_13080 [Streptomyces griseoviridis]